MIQTTFQTLKKQPEIILGVFIVFLVVVLAEIPLVTGMDDVMIDFQRLESGQTDAAHDVVSYYAKISLISLFIGIFSGFFAIPTLMNRTYEACAGIAEPGWIGRGIKRCWWKPFVMGLLIGAGAMVVSLVSIILAIIPILGQLILFAVMISMVVFAIISYTAVIAEPDLGSGLGGIFKIGSRYFFKLLGVVTVVIIVPMVLLSTVSGIIMSKNMMDIYSSTPTQDLSEAAAYMEQIMKPVYTMIVVMGLYAVFAYPFVYTYSMHQYLSTNGAKEPYIGPVSDYVIQSRDMTL
ncbi:MAG: hypothetical protein AB1Z23_02055 [Eubacteriales bacterium]